MTDARFPERWLMDRRFRRLTSDEFRTFAVSLMWAVANRTDGVLLEEDLEFVPDIVAAHAGRLVEVGLWAPIPSGWLIVDFEATQTSRGQLEGLEARKRQDADRAKRYRENKKSDRHVTASRDESRDSSVTGSRDDIGQDRQERTGSIQEHYETETVETETHPDSSGAGFCSSCGDELPGGGSCGWCFPAAPPVGVEPVAAVVEVPAAAPPVAVEGGCSVPGCAGMVTDYLRELYGGYCFHHAGRAVSA